MMQQRQLLQASGLEAPHSKRSLEAQLLASGGSRQFQFHRRCCCLLHVVGAAVQVVFSSVQVRCELALVVARTVDSELVHRRPMVDAELVRRCPWYVGGR